MCLKAKLFDKLNRYLASKLPHLFKFQTQAVLEASDYKNKQSVYGLINLLSPIMKLTDRYEYIHTNTRLRDIILPVNSIQLNKVQLSARSGHPFDQISAKSGFWAFTVIH